jgi:D-alanine-D-alanine ligase
MKTVAVIFGSKSAEHDVSIITALNSIISPLESSNHYDPLPVYINKKGEWYFGDELKDINLFTTEKINEYMAKNKPASLEFNDGCFFLTKTGGITGRRYIKKIDIVFPATHGTYGEDGSLMGVLRMAGIPFVGCDMESSVICMNKLLAKKVAAGGKIEVGEYLSFKKSDFESDAQAIIDQVSRVLGNDVFIKPVHLGSSIGISRAKNKKEISDGLELAFYYDTEVIVESTIENLIEVTVPVLGNGINLEVAMVERPLVKSGDFFNFETKYLNQGKGGKGGKNFSQSSGSQGYSELPAKIEGDLYSKCEQVAKDVFRELSCSGIARVDLLINSKTKKIVFNEINPMPGSLYAHNWYHKGYSKLSLCEKLLALAQDRYELENKTVTSFKTSFLKQF